MAVTRNQTRVTAIFVSESLSNQTESCYNYGSRKYDPRRLHEERTFVF